MPLKLNFIMNQSINYFLEYETQQIGHLPIIDWVRGPINKKRNYGRKEI